MSPCISFALQITLGYGSDKNVVGALNKACTISVPSVTHSFFGGSSPSTTNNGLFVASASAVNMSLDHQDTASRKNPTFAAVFVPPAMIGSSLEKFTANNKVEGSSFWVKEAQSAKFAKDLLPRMHSAFSNCTIRGIILTSINVEHNAPAEIVLLDLSRGVTVTDLLNTTNGQCLSDDPDAIIKIIPISQIGFSSKERPGEETASLSPPRSLLPTCPVCIHRIDPIRLGLPTPANQDLCSKFCPAPSFIGGHWASDSSDACTKQRFLKRWPHPSRCTSCHVIHQYWDQLTNRDEPNDLFCAQCAMHKTLWVCLTCGFVGCGRYSNKHSVAHFQETGHPYSLELATLRIWDYVDEKHGGYAHRADLLDCPSSPPLSHPWMTGPGLGLASSASSHATGLIYGTSFESMNGASPINTEKNPKKATMIGEEYEALLQSALEDQAQHYEGEITRLRADLTSALVDEGSMTAEEHKEIEEIKSDISRLRKYIDQEGRQLLDVQAQEAGHRATSQRLLAEQQATNDQLKKLQEEANRESDRGKMQVEDLELQVADLTANLRMRQQFSQSEELNQAQIFGTTAAEPKSAKRGKKKGRLFRK
jgi:hypothetical protein